MIDTWTNDPDSMARPRKILFSGRIVLDLGTYLYDGAGNIKSFGSRLFAYDRVSRLTEANLQPFSKAQSYTFDSFGNLNSITTTDSTDPLNPVTTPRPIGVSTATNRLTGASYDGSGNVTSLFTLTSFEYDPFNRVTHLAGTGVNKSFLYDTSDNRVAILDHQAQTEEWHLRGLHDKVVRSFLSSPEGWSWKQDWVYREGQLVGSTSLAKWREYHLDHLGSPRLVTGPIGLKVAEYHPFPFGEMASENGPGVDESENLFRYTGHERDMNCESGSCAAEGQDDLDYMLARLYSPVMGRFLEVDPEKRRSGIKEPQLFNRYMYVRGNPLIGIDPNGEDLFVVFDFSKSGLGVNQQNRVAFGVRQRFRRAGVDTVQIYFAREGVLGRLYPPVAPKELHPNDQIVRLRFENKTVTSKSGNIVYGKNTPPFTKSEVYTGPFLDGSTESETILINAASHEAAHATRAVPQYDNDAHPVFGVGAEPGSVMEQGVPPEVLGAGLREFSEEDARLLREKLNRTPADRKEEP